MDKHETEWPATAPSGERYSDAEGTLSHRTELHGRLDAGEVLYTYGYLNGSLSDIEAHVESLDAIVVDVRLKAWSRKPDWRKATLVKLLGSRYVQVSDLGNLNYKSQYGPILLKNEVAGMAMLRKMMNAAPVILLCACRDTATCHRTTVALIAYRMWSCHVEHLKKQTGLKREPPKPSQLFLF